ncbi:hypothetical protein P168DRAFT_98560 [Aspergillus campestris IBT 28561]|uniref:Uncharacterized protein n=1 Tax=Aspergillus campestris (strain IBT 28561) TaxID=1392248 RepID=A0A2I1DCK7_ASPC2|nr:uncharacterized protein P168DRAFT_98560 [Aspergillus campestris IBT 28561]PKY07590.1 hypothetical protein P168DRAFT_98560 [Aspergillus campestris IBT 28561]
MAVQKIIPRAEPPPSNANKRWPPMADKTSLPFRLTTLSKQKLAREATAPDPDIRRCLCHFRLHVMSVEMAQKDMTTRINSFDLESESESEDEDAGNHKKNFVSRIPAVPEPAAKKDVSPESAAADAEKDSAIQVHFEVSFEQSADTSKEQSQQTQTQSQSQPQSQPQSQTSGKESDSDGFMEKGRTCLEKTKNLWPSPGQCLPIQISG